MTDIGILEEIGLVDIERKKEQQNKGYMNKLKKMPKFKTEDAESEFWAAHNSPEYVDYSMGKKVLFPNLRPSLRLYSMTRKQARDTGIERRASRQLYEGRR